MPVFVESNLQFNFDGNFWSGLKKIDDHIDYKKIEVLNGSKAVDFLGFCSETLIFIEVKNFKSFRIANRSRVAKNGEALMIEVGCKVKDTIAGAVGGARNSTNDRAEWISCISHLNSGNDIKVVLWLEEDNPVSKREKAGLGIYTNSLKTKLKWLTGGGNHVMVIDSSSNDLPGLIVNNLPN